MRLYKAVGTQPFPLLCLSGTAGPSCGWRLHAGGCMLAEPNREVCQISSRLMEHLTHRRSQFELSHILMTPPEACHHGCYPTQCTHSARSCILKRKTFHQQKHLFDVTKQLSLIRFVSFSSHVTQKVLLTHSSPVPVG